MRKAYTLYFIFLSATVFGQNNTFPISGNVGIGVSPLGSRTLAVQSTTNDVNLESVLNRPTGTNYAIAGSAIGVGAGLNQGGFFSASGGTGNFGIRIYNVLATPSNYALYSDSPAQSYFQGNVGIGTGSPLTPFHVTGGSSMTSGWNKTSTLQAIFPVQIFNSNSTKWGGIGYDYTTAMRFWVNASSDDVAGTGNPAVNILNNGSVGIGTINPLAKFHILNTTESEIRVQESTNNNTIALYQQANDSYIIAGKQSGIPSQNLRIYTGGVDRMILTNTGNIGIGTTNPQNKLDVRGTFGVGTAANGENGLSISSINTSGLNHIHTFSGPSNGTNDDIIWELNRGGGAYGSFNVKFNTVSRFYVGGNNMNPNAWIIPQKNFGIGTTTPANKLEIKSDTVGRSGLRFTNLINSSNKVLSVNSTGDVVLVDGMNTTVNNLEVLDFSNGCANPTSENAGVIIKTNIPFQTGNGMFNINIEGYNYGTAQSIDLKIGFHLYSTPAIIYAKTISSSGGYAPQTYIYNDNGFVSLYLKKGFVSQYCINFKVRAWDQLRNRSTSTYYTGWVAQNTDVVPTATSNFEEILYINTTNKIDIAGNAGINFISPNPQFNSGKMASILPRNVGNGYGDLVFETYQGGSGGGERMRIGANGNIGIGTSSPTSQLQVESTSGSPEINSKGSQYPLIVSTSTTNNVRTKIQSIGSGNVGYVGTESNHQLSLIVNNDPKMSIATNGNVGIGTTSPSAKLEVTGNGIIVNNVGTSSYGSAIKFRNDGYAHYSLGVKGNLFLIGLTSSDGSLVWGPTTDLIAINPTGNIGIGTTNPSEKLDILGNIRTTKTKSIIWNDSNDEIRVEDNPSWFTTKPNVMTFKTFAGAFNFRDSQTNTNLFTILNNGQVAIGTATPYTDYKLSVVGNIIAEKVKVKKSANGLWPDFVFSPSYKLPTLNEIENFVKQNSHLPEIPSAKEIEKEGQDLGEMNRLLLKKVEELTLYLIEQNKEIKSLKSKVELLEKK